MNKKMSKTAQLVLGAGMLAIFLVLHIIVPGGNRSVQSLLMVITFLPITLYVLRCGIRFATLLVLAGGVLSAIILHPLVLMAYALPGLIIGVVFGLLVNKVKKSVCILVLSALHLLQNIFEIVLYYKMMGVSLMDSFQQTIDKLMGLISSVTSHEAVLSFAHDVIICGIPAALIVSAVVKGMLSFIVLKLVLDKLSSFLGIDKIDGSSDILRMNGKLLSWIYFGIVAVYAVIALMVFFGVFPYGLWFATCTAIVLLCMVAYVYYFYLKRIRSNDVPAEKRMIYSVLLVCLLPVNVFALPLLELHLLMNEERRDAEKSGTA